MRFLLNKQYALFPFLFFLLISGLLIFSWFRFGQYYGGGDVGLPTYNPSRVFDIVKYVWWEAAAPGFPVPHGVTSAPLEFFLSILQHLGFTTLFLQATLFFILLFLMGFGMYLFILSNFNLNRNLALFGAIFYMFNPYMTVQIWHRFVHTSIVLVAILPFMALFWQRWIRNQKPLALFLFLLTNFLGTYLYGTIAFIITVWVFIILLTVSEALIPWKNFNSLVKYSGLFLIGLILWLLTNSWWLIPSFSIGSGLFNQQHSSDESLSTLLEISKQTILPFTLQFLNPFYIFQQAEFGGIYKNIFFKIIPWVSALIIFIGLIKSLQQKQAAKWGIIFLILIFLAKGAATPFGYPFIWGFSRFFFLGVLRNPFEKIGILLPFVGSILFILGITVITTWSNKIINGWSKALLVCLLFLIIGYSWPMLTGKIFGRIDKPAFIKVPYSYVETDKWISQNSNQGNILHLPLTRNEGVTYNWQYGYNGVEPSQLIFASRPSISRGFNITRLDDTLTGLSLMFEKPYSQKTEQILQLIQAFNVYYIILHKDIRWRGSDIYDPQEVEEILNNLNFLEKKAQFGDLTVYELSPEYYQPKIILSSQVQFVFPQESTIRMWPWLAKLSKAEILTPQDYKNIDLLKNSQEIMVFPNESFSYLEGSEKGLDIIGSNLVSFLYQLSNTKSTIIKSGDKDSEKIITQMISTGEDLINIYLSIKNGDSQVSPFINRYIQTTNELVDRDIRGSKIRFFVSENTVNDIFKLHLIILENLKVGELLVIKDKIKQDLTKKSLLPNYSYINKEDFTIQQRQINRFQIPKAGNYELLLTNSQIREIYPANLSNLNFQIDDKLINLKGIVKGDLISFGELDLPLGNHEISFNNYLSTNLIPSLENIHKSENVKPVDKDTLQLNSDGQQASYIEADLGPVSGEDNYQVIFDGSFLSGGEFYVQIIQNGDSVENGKSRPRIGTFIYRTKNDTSFQSFGFKLPPLNVATRQAKIRILVDPTGTTSFNTPSLYGTPTIVQIKNLKVFRVLDNGIFLRSELKQDSQPTPSGQITKIVQRSPVLYQGNLKIDRPSFMIFKESYHPGWELTLRSGNEIYKPVIHYLANLYSNAWLIEKEGEYNFKIEFKPQQKMTVGLYLATIGWIISLSLVIWSNLKGEVSK